MTRRISGYDIAKRKTTAALKELVTSDRNAETKLHIAIVDLLKATALPGVIWWHTPNGGKRSKREAAKLKEMGVRAGVPDLIICQPNGRIWFMEIKTPKGRVSDDQKAFIHDVEANGFAPVFVVRSIAEAAECFTIWGAVRRVKVAA